MAPRFAQALPDARCELYYETPFQLLCSVVLSAQTTDKMVNRCMEPIYREQKNHFTPEYLIKLGQVKLLEQIRSIGLAPTKAKNLINLSTRLKEQFAGEVPKSREDLESLPGVGRKTANVILGEIWRQPTLAVDTHVFRVSQRLGLQDEKTPEKAEQVLLQIIAPSYLPTAHHWFILHGRYTCKAAKPACAICCVEDLCPSSNLAKQPAKQKSSTK